MSNVVPLLAVTEKKSSDVHLVKVDPVTGNTTLVGLLAAPQEEKKFRPVSSVVFHPDGRYLAVLHENSSSVTVWDALEGKRLHKFCLSRHGGKIDEVHKVLFIGEDNVYFFMGFVCRTKKNVLDVRVCLPNSYNFSFVVPKENPSDEAAANAHPVDQNVGFLRVMSVAVHGCFDSNSGVRVFIGQPDNHRVRVYRLYRHTPQSVRFDGRLYHERPTLPKFDKLSSIVTLAGVESLTVCDTVLIVSHRACTSYTMWDAASSDLNMQFDLENVGLPVAPPSWKTNELISATIFDTSKVDESLVRFRDFGAFDWFVKPRGGACHEVLFYSTSGVLARVGSGVELWTFRVRNHHIVCLLLKMTVVAGWAGATTLRLV